MSKDYENLSPEKLVGLANEAMRISVALSDMYPKDIIARVECAKALLELAHICANWPLHTLSWNAGSAL